MITIRPGDIEDLPEIHFLDQRCFPPGVAFTPDAFMMLLMDKSAVTLIAEAEGTMAGFAIMESKSKTAGNIITIDMEEAWRRRGAGRRLMEELETEARKRGYREMFLQVSVDNAAATAFYEKLGYSRTKPLKGYYGRGKDAWEMVKTL
ncbi:MAG: GNAT family N-acetyltransferase [Nitrospinae bacterium]|nr:GNAT family N-acetyltransferase [Nitrospinota bacterium]